MSKKKRAAAKRPITARRAKTPLKAAPARRRTRTAKSSGKSSGTIGQAATKVVKSGARLVQHAGQRMIVAGAKATMGKLEEVLHSAVGATSTALKSAATRVQKIAGQ
jgi:hypothetical protein